MQKFDLKPILEDIQVELTEEFTENFRRKGFFENNGWKHSKGGDPSRTMLKSGNLWRSIRGEVKGNSVEFTSSLPYASIHNVLSFFRNYPVHTCLNNASYSLQRRTIPTSVRKLNGYKI